MYNFIITFGQDHAHRVNGYTFDKDSVAVIKANSHEEARVIAVDLFGLKFCTSHQEIEYDNRDMGKYFPRGKHPANFKEEKNG